MVCLFLGIDANTCNCCNLYLGQSITTFRRCAVGGGMMNLETEQKDENSMPNEAISDEMDKKAVEHVIKIT